MRLIDADALIDVLKKHKFFTPGNDLITCHRHDEVDCCIYYVEHAPTVDTDEERSHE